MAELESKNEYQQKFDEIKVDKKLNRDNSSASFDDKSYEKRKDWKLRNDNLENNFDKKNRTTYEKQRQEHYEYKNETDRTRKIDYQRKDRHEGKTYETEKRKIQKEDNWKTTDRPHEYNRYRDSNFNRGRDRNESDKRYHKNRTNDSDSRQDYSKNDNRENKQISKPTEKKTYKFDSPPKTNNIPENKEEFKEFGDIAVLANILPSFQNITSEEIMEKLNQYKINSKVQMSKMENKLYVGNIPKSISERMVSSLVT